MLFRHNARTRAAFYISEYENKSKLNITILIFEIISMKIHTLSYTFEPIVTAPKHHSEFSNRFFICRKTYVKKYGNKKNSFGSESELYCGCSKCSCLSWCVKAPIVVMKSNLSLAVGFSDFLEGNWHRKGCVTAKIDDSSLL